MESYLIISKLTKGFTSNYFPDDNNNYYIAYYPRSIINNVFYHTQYNNNYYQLTDIIQIWTQTFFQKLKRHLTQDQETSIAINNVEHVYIHLLKSSSSNSK